MMAKQMKGRDCEAELREAFQVFDKVSMRSRYKLNHLHLKNMPVP